MCGSTASDAAQKSIDAGKYQLPAGADPTTVLAFLKKDGIVPDPQGRFIHAMSSYGARKLAKDAGITLDEAHAQIEAGITLSDIHRKAFVDALSGKDAGKNWAEQVPGSAAEMNRSLP